MRRAFLPGVLCHLSTMAAIAQTVAGLGAITGSVRETSGAGLPNADVAVINESKGIRRHLTRNDVGFFSAASPDALAFIDRKSTRLNSSHGYISYAVFCLKKKTFGR